MTLDAQPLVTVVVPAYNSSAFLRQAVDSALGQTYPFVEVIVVDDGSTDGTTEVVAGYGSKIVFIHQRNAGVAAARNTALRVARGELVAYLDADDVWDPDKVRRQVEFLAAHPECGLVHTEVTLVDQARRPIDDWVSRRHLASGRSFSRLIRRNSIVTSSAMHWTRLVDTQGAPFDTSLVGAEDWDLWLRIAAHHHIGFLNEPLTHYRLHQGNATRRQKRRLFQDTIRVLDRMSAGSRNPWHRLLAAATCARYARDLGHVEYADGNFALARRHFIRAGFTLDRLGVVRLGCTFLPPPVYRWLKRTMQGPPIEAPQSGVEKGGLA